MKKEVVLRKLTAPEAEKYTGPVFADVTGDCSDLACIEYAVIISTSESSIRTILQNSSIRLYAKWVAKLFNDAGITKKYYFSRRKMEGSWTAESFLENVWRDIQENLYGHRKTSKLERAQVSVVYNEIAKFLSVRFKVDQSFPNRHGD